MKGIDVLPNVRRAISSVDEALAEGRFSDAFVLAKGYADKGDAWAETCLGTLFMFGLGVEEDHVKAESYLRMAASKNHGGAWYSLGELYSREDLIQHDPDQARRCYARAEELGYYPGQAIPGFFEDSD